MSRPKIVFMGTPEFAVPSLEILITHDYPIVGIVTQPDRPKGRGRVFAPSPVKVLAGKYHLPVSQPERMKDPKVIDYFRSLSPDLVVVVAFGQILPPEILEIPKMGCINVHPSLLPKFRGAAPMNWTIIRGEVKTGVTIMLMDEGLDTGDILTQEETMIDAEETFGELHDQLANSGAALLLKTVEMITSGTVTRTSQNDYLATYAPRLKKKDGLIRWKADVRQIVNLIRGLSPIPCAYTSYKGKILKIFSARVEEVSVTETPGKVGSETQAGLPIAARNGYVYLTDIQLENKKRMSVHDFLRGFRIPPGDVLD
jgi:methionyl-tRNA formyltransferase